MATPDAAAGAQTPAATAAQAQSRDATPPADAGAPVPCPGEGTLFRVGAGVVRAVSGRPHEHKQGEPLYRPLRIYTLDPAESRLEGAVATVNVPYEPLEPGPAGRLFEVESTNQVTREVYRSVDLDSPTVLIASGIDPSPGDPRFHQQMVYAVCSTVYAAFRQALGRHPSWGFREAEGEGARLRIVPHAFEEANAYYDPERGELAFGYYPLADGARVYGRNVPGGWVFTCLSHDVVAHEVTHALLDGLRSHFALPTRPDVLAFHEAFADLVAIFQHFSYRDVVLAAIRTSRGEVDRARLLTDLARQFGHTVGAADEGVDDHPEQALRSAVEVDYATGKVMRRMYDATLQRYQLASVLVSAVFEAFNTLYRRRTERFVRLATGGTGELPPGELQADLREVLADQASKLANQFLTLCIRAIDYCPPMDLEFGEFLRAVITADRDVVPDDRWSYREAWVDAFAAHGIYPRGVASLHEDALLWRAPTTHIPTARELSFAELKFRGDPARPAGEDELRRQACALGSIVTRPELLREFGLAAADDPALGGDTVETPCVQSIRTSRRVGPDGQVVFDLVAEITQRRNVRRDGQEFTFHGGSTVILGPDGDVRYVVGKGILNERRLADQIAFTTGGNPFWKLTDGGRWEADKLAFKLMHEKTGHAGSA